MFFLTSCLKKQVFSNKSEVFFKKWICVLFFFTCLFLQRLFFFVCKSFFFLRVLFFVFFFFFLNFFFANDYCFLQGAEVFLQRVLFCFFHAFVF